MGRPATSFPRIVERRAARKERKIIVVFYAEDSDKNAERENYDTLKQVHRTPRIFLARTHNAVMSGTTEPLQNIPPIRFRTF